MKKIKILFAILMMFTFATFAQVSVSITATIAPPPLVVYSQPACPQDGYIWTPGYWAYGDDGYFWVPGVWVSPPEPDYYWTPCYWGFDNGVYGFYPGYWGPSIGFYGGVDYGYGYGGYGYDGGRWSGGHFHYNTAVTNVNRAHVHNVYVDRSVASSRPISNRTSFNGPGGISRQPRAEERVAMGQRHTSFTSQQEKHQQTARRNRNQFATVNHGKPAITSMNKVGGRRYNSQGHVAATKNHTSARPHPTNRTVQTRTNSRVQAQRHATTAPQRRAPAQEQRPVNNAPQQRAPAEQHAQPQMQQSRPAPQQQRAPQEQHTQAPPQQHMEQHAPMGGGERGGGRRR